MNLSKDVFYRSCCQLQTDNGKLFSANFFNVGTGSDITIRELAQLIKEIVGYDGEIVWDKSKSDGTPKKLLDVSRNQKMGWQAEIPLEQGIESTYKTYFVDRNFL